jgi:hypothetical protein
MASNLLARAVVSGEPTLMDIPCYYTYRKNEYGIQKLVILKETKAKKMLADDKKKDQVEVLNTKWKEPNWEEQNDIVTQCVEISPVNNQKEVNWTIYRRLCINCLLVDWDLSLDGKKIPVSEEYIKRMPPEIILDIYEKFQKASNIEPDEQGKS